MFFKVVKRNITFQCTKVINTVFLGVVESNYLTDLLKQSFWNNMELKIVKIVDIIAPITKFSNNYVPPRIPPLIKSKINKRNKLLNLKKRNSSNELKCRINVLNFEIKQFYLAQKKERVRKGILPGNSKSLWTSVNVAKDVGNPEIQ